MGWRWMGLAERAAMRVKGSVDWRVEMWEDVGRAVVRVRVRERRMVKMVVESIVVVVLVLG